MVIFKNKTGVRSGWRAAAFVLFALIILTAMTFMAILPLYTLFGLTGKGITAPAFLIQEIGLFVAVFGATWIMAGFEKRRWDSYGLPVDRAFRARYWEGIGMGVVAAAIVAAGMFAYGGFEVHGFGLQGAQWVIQPVLWALAMLLVGVTEEYLFRGYLLQSLKRGMGFWGAAIVTSVLFGAAHLNKPDENFIDIANIVILGMFTCFALYRTGNLWLAAGFHSAFDFMQFFVIGTRNGGDTPVGTLFHSTFPGPAWINGGPLGTEASWFMIPVMVALFVYVAARFRNDPDAMD